MRKEIFEIVGYFDEKFKTGFFEDVDFINRCHQKELKWCQSAEWRWLWRIFLSSGKAFYQLYWEWCITNIFTGWCAIHAAHYSGSLQKCRDFPSRDSPVTRTRDNIAFNFLVKNVIKSHSTGYLILEQSKKNKICRCFFCFWLEKDRNSNHLAKSIKQNWMKIQN